LNEQQLLDAQRQIELEQDLERELELGLGLEPPLEQPLLPPQNQQSPEQRSVAPSDEDKQLTSESLTGRSISCGEENSVAVAAPGMTLLLGFLQSEVRGRGLTN